MQESKYTSESFVCMGVLADAPKDKTRYTYQKSPDGDAILNPRKKEKKEIGEIWIGGLKRHFFFHPNPSLTH